MVAQAIEPWAEARTTKGEVNSRGEPSEVMRGLMWNSCTSSAVLLGLLAIGVVLLL
jgi:hypothetical protein